MTHDTALAREQSAALAAMLGQSGTQGGTPIRPPTRKGRLMLDALKASPKGAATPDELLAGFPAEFAGWTWQSFHLVAQVLARNGWVKRGRRNSGPRLYRLTELGRQA